MRKKFEENNQVKTKSIAFSNLARCYILFNLCLIDVECWMVQNDTLKYLSKLLDSICSVACVNVIPILYVQRRSYAIFLYFCCFFHLLGECCLVFIVSVVKKFSIILENSIDFVIFMTLGCFWKFDNVLWRIHKSTDTDVRLLHL